MSRKRKILDILGMILGVLLVIVNGMMVGLEYMYQVGDKIYMLGTMRDKMIPLVFGVFCFPDLQRAPGFQTISQISAF